MASDPAIPDRQDQDAAQETDVGVAACRNPGLPHQQLHVRLERWGLPAVSISLISFYLLSFLVLSNKVHLVNCLMHGKSIVTPPWYGGFFS